MYAIVVSNYEAREKEILAENQALRQFLLQLYKGMDQTLDDEVKSAAMVCNRFLQNNRI